MLLMKEENGIKNTEFLDGKIENHLKLFVLNVEMNSQLRHSIIYSVQTNANPPGEEKKS